MYEEFVLKIRNMKVKMSSSEDHSLVDDDRHSTDSKNDGVDNFSQSGNLYLTAQQNMETNDDAV
jgi:hypothetical protein